MRELKFCTFFAKIQNMVLVNIIVPFFSGLESFLFVRFVLLSFTREKSENANPDLHFASGYAFFQCGSTTLL